MMIIMPTVTQSHQSHKPLVVALIICIKITLAKAVADRIDTPGNMLLEENPHKACPKKASPSINRERDQESQCHPEPECAANKDNDWVFEQMATVHLGVGSTHTYSEEPAKMGMPESFERAMRITLTI